MNTEKKIKTETIDSPKWKTIEDYQRALYDAHENDDPNELEFFLLHRPDEFKNNKVRGEEEMLDWLVKTLKERYDRAPMVELNEKGIIVPI